MANENQNSSAASSEGTRCPEEKSFQAPRVQNTIRIGGRGPGGPGRGQEVEKPKNAMQTLGRLVQYFSRETSMLAGLLAVVIVTVICSVFAPKLQSDAIDKITNGEFDTLVSVLALMLLLM